MHNGFLYVAGPGGWYHQRMTSPHKPSSPEEYAVRWANLVMAQPKTTYVAQVTPKEDVMPYRFVVLGAMRRSIRVNLLMPRRIGDRRRRGSLAVDPTTNDKTGYYDERKMWMPPF